ncbi:MAG: macro domain-containing protein [Gammaproteobacteria bacterium]|nr:macro domain-containing protein [Gammaproteobacteria bacterium]
MKIRYIQGDATAPCGSGTKVLVHICNDLGQWGKGFVLAVSERWPLPEKTYRAAFTHSPKPALGNVQFVAVSDDLYVANLIGQHGIANAAQGKPPIRYAAVRQGLAKVARFAKQHAASVHMPRIGCGLAGGSWEKIEPILNDTFTEVSVTVYDR